MAITWNQAMWEGLYQTTVGRQDHAKFGQVIKGLTREFAVLMQNPHSDALDFYIARRDKLISLFNLQITDRIVVVGCAFGFLIEVFHDAGYLNVWGVENSPWIIANRATQTRADVLFVEDDIRGGNRMVNALKRLTGGNGYDYVITEDVINSYTDAEVGDIFAGCESLLASGKPSGNIIHLVTVTQTGRTQDTAVVWRRLDEWKTRRGAHTFIASGTFERL